MKTIPQRAREALATRGDLQPEVERVLRELVEEIAAWVPLQFNFTSQDVQDKIRRCFLGPPSAEEVAFDSLCVDPDFHTIFLAHGGSPGGRPIAARIVKALRSAGLLRESAPEPGEGR